MRLASIAIAFSLGLAVTSSIGRAQDPEPSARAAALIAEGRAALAAGDPQGAVDYFEAALVVDPAYTPLLLELGAAARQNLLQGKAIAYYREALRRDPDNWAALSGEGAALLEKGAVEKARAKLAELGDKCGRGCPETEELAGIIAAGPKTPTLRAEAVLPNATVTQN